ncbi:hypothetical protein RHO14_10660 [Orbus wheelerorum]|uniref:SMI1/KNR4 family protein n=1 Tax=Orbus wheelerorum TaxID=3074111 RepID=UPI00370D72A9
MFKSQIEYVINILKNNNIRLKQGMTETQIKQAQHQYQIEFPLELKSLLMAVLPVSAPFYDWIDSSQTNKTYIKNALNWPLEGMLFDVEHNGFWLSKQWGTEPKAMIERLTIAEKNIKQMPKLVPIYSHRYLANTNSDQLSPVLSIYQTDIIYYGKNLWDYFAVEFNVKPYKDIDLSSIFIIPFWSDWIE